MKSKIVLSFLAICCIGQLQAGQTGNHPGVHDGDSVKSPAAGQLSSVMESLQVEQDEKLIYKNKVLFYFDVEAGYSCRIGEITSSAGESKSKGAISRNYFHAGGAFMLGMSDEPAHTAGITGFVNLGRGDVASDTKGNNVAIYFAGFQYSYCAKQRYDRRGAFICEASFGYAGYNEKLSFSKSGNDKRTYTGHGIGVGLGAGYGFYGPKLRGPYIKGTIFWADTMDMTYTTDSGFESKSGQKNMSSVNLIAGFRF